MPFRELPRVPATAFPREYTLEADGRASCQRARSVVAYRVWTPLRGSQRGASPLGKMISLPSQPRKPVSSLGAKFLLVEYGIRQPSFHRPPDQPTVAASAQILILWNPDAEL